MTRVTRSRAAKQVQDPTLGDDTANTVEDEVDEAEYRPRMKRARRSTGQAEGDGGEAPPAVPRKRTKGKLARLQDTPLDILFMIFASLHPYDLLRVSWTTKTFRRLIMARSARQTWVESLAAVPDIPPQPDDLTEPAWTRLLFDSTCHLCNERVVRHALWQLRMRICNACHENDRSELVRSDYTSIPHDLQVVDHFVFYYRVPWDHHRGPTLFRRHEYDAMMEALRKQKAGDETQKAFIDERTARAKRIHDHAYQCTKWFERQKSQRHGDLQANRQNRKNAIAEHLCGLGYGRDIEWMQAYINPASYRRELQNEFDSLKSVKQPKELTPRMWSNIKTEVVNFMDQIRANRETEARLKTLKQRVEHLVSVTREHTAPHDCPPHIADLDSIPTIRELLDRPLANGQDTVTRAIFAQVVVNFDETVAHCRQHRRDALLSHLRVDGVPLPAEADLALATSIFECPAHVSSWLCSRGGFLSAAEMRAHRCLGWGLRAEVGRPGRRDWDVRERQAQLDLVCSWIPDAGGPGHVGVQAAVRERAARIVALAGLDPASATAEEMDAVGAWFVCSSLCLVCKYRATKGQRPIHNWRHAMKHGNSQKRISPEQETKAQAAAAAFMPNPVSGYDSYSTDCVHCPTTYLRTSRELQEHFLNAHGIEKPTPGDDFTVSDCFLRPTPKLEIPWEEDAGSTGALAS